MKFHRRVLFAVSALFLCAMIVVACGDDDEGSDPVLAPGQGKVTSEVTLPWQQVGDAQLKVLSANTFRTGAGEYVYLVGEIENTGDQQIGNVKVASSAYNEQGEIVDTRDVDVLLPLVPPGEKIPFATAMDAREVDRYELEIQGDPDQAEPQYQLEIVDPTMGEPKSGYVWLEGQVNNAGTDDLDGVTVVGVLYNDEGEVVEAVSTPLEEALAAGDSTPFKVIASYRDATSFEMYVHVEDVE